MTTVDMLDMNPHVSKNRRIKDRKHEWGGLCERVHGGRGEVGNEGMW